MEYSGIRMNYIANTPEQQKEMLKTCGMSSMADLFSVIPEQLRTKSFDLPSGKSEMEVEKLFKGIVNENRSDILCFLGGGVYDHFVPAAIDAVISRSEFYTAYTPYQPELSQGTLQAIYEYQSQMCRLTNMEVANASLYDGGTALFEACQMAVRATGRKKAVIDGGVNPIYRKMLNTHTAGLPVDLVDVPVTVGRSDRKAITRLLDNDTAVLILQNPSFFGAIDNHADLVQECHSRGILVVQSVYPVAMAVLTTPGEIGVDIVTGEGQSLGIPLSFGGPYLGFMTTTRKLVRKMPGRVVGRTVDRDGREAFVLTLQAREQHIRREKATSNICTNEALCALRAHLYLSLVGRNGLKDAANLCRAKTRYAMERLKAVPKVEIVGTDEVFNEFVVKLPVDANTLTAGMLEHGVAPGLPLGLFYPDMQNMLLVTVTEKRTKDEIDCLAETMESVLCP